MPEKKYVLFLYIFLGGAILPAQIQLPTAFPEDAKECSQVASGDSTEKMADLGKYIPGIKMDLRYSTPLNFTGRRLYPVITTTYMRLPAASALAGVQQELNKKNLGLKIFDAYRPYSITVKMWELIKDERYVADPKKGSGHNRGIAVDLTIIDLATGNALDMGTDFDNFTNAAHHSYTEFPQVILNNRKLLRTVMEKHGFKALETEWWHYSFQSIKEFAVLDIGFEDLQKL